MLWWKFILEVAEKEEIPVKLSQNIYQKYMRRYFQDPFLEHNPSRFKTLKYHTMLRHGKNLWFRMVNPTQRCHEINFLWDTSLRLPLTPERQWLWWESWLMGNRYPGLWDANWQNSIWDKKLKRSIQDRQQ